jgi:hypothetical protein
MADKMKRIKDSRSLIVARLTKTEYRRFMKRGIICSGATGEGAKRSLYDGLGPYIATYRDLQREVLKVLGWKHPWVLDSPNHQGGQRIICRKSFSMKVPANAQKSRLVARPL